MGRSNRFQIFLCTAWLAIVLASLASSAAAQNAQWGIFVMKADGSQPRLIAQVEGCERHGRPRWSPDGKQVVFDVELQTTHHTMTYLVNTDGSGLQKVGDFGGARWSPDGKQLIFKSNGRTCIQNLDGGGRTELEPGGSPCLSPDGSQLAVLLQDNIQVTDLVTGESRTLFARPKDTIYYGFSWFPDGQRLAVVARPEPRKPRELLYVSAAGEEQGVEVRLKGEMAGYISFSPDGKTLLLDTSYKVHLLKVDGTSKPVLVTGQAGASRDPDWSPDGEWIVFSSSRDLQ